VRAYRVAGVALQRTGGAIRLERKGGEVMGWEDIAPEVPMWKSEPECKNCKLLKEMYADSCSESNSLLSDLKNEQTSVNELSLHCQYLSNALKRIDDLSENMGSQASWKAVYVEAQTIAQKALDGK